MSPTTVATLGLLFVASLILQCQALPQNINTPTATKTQATQLVVTATTGSHEVVTFIPTQDPKYSDLKGTTTVTDEDHTTIVFPDGWFWVPVGPGTPPVIPPDVIEDPDLTEEEEEEECKPPKPRRQCTKTLSWTLEPTGVVLHEKGKCPAATKCEVGPQRTVSKTISTEIATMTVGAFSGSELTEPESDLPPDQETVQYFSDLFIELGIYEVEATCLNLGFDATKKDVNSKIDEWCKAMGGKKLESKDGKDAISYHRYNHDSYSFSPGPVWLSIGNKSNKECAGKSTIDQIECSSMLKSVISECDDTSDRTHGAWVQDDCLQYNVTFSASRDGDSPPWAPKDKPVCGKEQEPFVDEMLEKAAEKFCESVDKDADAALKQTITDVGMHDVKENDNVYPRGARIEFEFTGAKSTCTTSCIDAYKNMHNTCEQSSEGKLVVTCGTYSYKALEPEPSCEDKTTALRVDAFYGDERKVPEQFCKDVESHPGQSQYWAVDAEGNHLPRLGRRTPPVDLDNFQYYRYVLDWKARGSGEDNCRRSCMEAYEYITKSGDCGYLPDKNLVRSGHYDVGCGVYSWTVEDEMPRSQRPGYSKLELGEQKCNDEKDFPGHYDAEKEDLHYFAVRADPSAPKSMNKDSPTWTNKMCRANAAPACHKQTAYEFSIEWAKGCITDEDDIDTKMPLGKNAKGWDGNDLNDYRLWSNSYENCNNGGVGGWNQVGK
ncbi:hypothetical protein E8E14_001933 [Neopestalotiopsis sp. 37M]|nr:hypothetical protein E8E14_001933 [Neopestalotiopsis sp. 37M]